MRRDTIFSDPKRAASDFKFGSETAEVFDDMLERSVPFYAETQRMMGELAKEFVQPDTNIYDLGCSTGTTLSMLDPLLPANVRLIGFDSSPEMLEKARKKTKATGTHRQIEFLPCDLNNGVQIADASLVILNLTLQFVRPLKRDLLIRQIAEGLRDRGALILIEKVLNKTSLLNRLFIKSYYDFKERNGYSKLEISQKREALENVLIPYRVAENEELLLRNGFSECETFFRWYNFCAFVAVK